MIKLSFTHIGLKGNWKHLDTFLAIFYMGNNFCDFLFAFLHTDSFWKGAFSIRKEYAPSGSESNSIPISEEWTLFQKGIGVISTGLSPLKIYQLPLLLFSINAMTFDVC